MQQELALAVGPLVAALGGIRAAVQLQVQLAVPGGQQIARCGLKVPEKIPYVGLAHTRRGREGPHFADVLQHLACRATPTVAMSKDHEQLLLQLLLLEIRPGAQGLGGRGHGVIGTDKRWAGRGAEMDQHPAAVDPLPPEAVVGQAIVLIPADLDGHKIFQAGLLDQLRQRPRVSKDVRQPEHGGISVGAKVLAEKTAAQQKLARQRFGSAQIAVGFNPHAADGLPAPLRHALFDRLQQLRVILPHIVVKLGLALGEMVVGELLHQAQYGVERAPRFSSCLSQRPQPSDVDVGVTGGDDTDVLWWAGLLDASTQHVVRRRYASVESIAKGLTDVQDLESFIQCVVQMPLGRLVIAEPIGNAERHAGGGDKIPGVLVDLHDGALAYEELCVRVAPAPASPARPAVQRQQVGLTIAPALRQQELLVVPVTSCVGHTIDVGQKLWVTKVPGHAQR